MAEEDNSFAGRVRRYAQVSTAVGGLAARLAGERYLGLTLDRDRHAEGNCSPAILGRPTAADQQQVCDDHPLDHCPVVEPVSYRLLIKMLAVRLPDPLTAQQPPEKSDRRVGKEIERQNQCDLPVAAGGQAEQQEARQIAERNAADISEKDSRRRPVPPQKTDRGTEEAGSA